MHELSIIKPVIDSLTLYMKKNHIKQLKKVVLNIGELNGVVPEVMDFNFMFATKNTKLEDAKLKINIIPVKIKCNDCMKQNKIENNYFECKSCHSGNIKIISGKELEIHSIEY